MGGITVTRVGSRCFQGVITVITGSQSKRTCKAYLLKRLVELERQIALIITKIRISITSLLGITRH